jgi:hypothetical protein
VPPASTHVGLAQQDVLGALHDRLEAGSAQAVHGERRCLLGHADPERDVAREVERVGRRLERVAEEGVSISSGLDSRGLDRGRGCSRAEIRGGEVLEDPPNAPNPVRLPDEEDDVPSVSLRSHLFSSCRVTGSIAT